MSGFWESGFAQPFGRMGGGVGDKRARRVDAAPVG